MKNIEELIRGEISAVESFDTVINRVKDQSELTELSQIRQDHQNAVETLKRFAGATLEGNTETSGPWGTFATAFAGGASVFGDKAAINALKIGEQHGLNEYQEALMDDGVRAEVKEVIRAELIPCQERHLAMIENYLH
ncbi:MAG: DUF2383 domain-containing protein [Bdellovibrionota bacterium]